MQSLNLKSRIVDDLFWYLLDGRGQKVKKKWFRCKRSIVAGFAFPWNRGRGWTKTPKEPPREPFSNTKETVLVDGEYFKLHLFGLMHSTHVKTKPKK